MVDAVAPRWPRSSAPVLRRWYLVQKKGGSGRFQNVNGLWRNKCCEDKKRIGEGKARRIRDVVESVSFKFLGPREWEICPYVGLRPLKALRIGQGLGLPRIGFAAAGWRELHLIPESPRSSTGYLQPCNLLPINITIGSTST